MPGECEGFNNLQHGWDEQHYAEEQVKINQKAEEEHLDHVPHKITPSLEYASGIINGIGDQYTIPF